MRLFLPPFFFWRRERARVRDRDREKEADKEDVIREQKEVEEEIQRQQAAEAERQRAEAEANGAFASPRVVGLKLDRKKRSRVDVAAAFDDTEDTTYAYLVLFCGSLYHTYTHFMRGYVWRELSSFHPQLVVLCLLRSSLFFFRLIRIEHATYPPRRLLKVVCLHS